MRVREPHLTPANETPNTSDCILIIDVNKPPEVLEPSVHRLVQHFFQITESFRTLNTLEKLTNPFQKAALKNAIDRNCDTNNNKPWLHLITNNANTDYCIDEMINILVSGAHKKIQYDEKITIIEIPRNLFRCLSIIIPLLEHCKNHSVTTPIITTLLLGTFAITPFYIYSKYNHSYVYDITDHSIQWFSITKHALYHSWPEKQRSALNTTLSKTLSDFHQNNLTSSLQLLSDMQEILLHSFDSNNPPLAVTTTISSPLTTENITIPVARIIELRHRTPEFLMSETYTLIESYHKLKQHLNQSIRHRWEHSLSHDTFTDFFFIQITQPFYS